MHMDTHNNPEHSQATVLAAIDIGSNSIRMSIAQILTDGDIEVLEKLRQSVRLGQDSFRNRRLGNRSMQAAVSILRDYRQVIDTYKVIHIRAVATSAVREAVNADAFIDRILMATGIEVEIIDTSEESRLTVSAVRDAMGKSFRAASKNCLIAEVGGGSTLISVLHKGKISLSLNLPIGSIRLQELFVDSLEDPKSIRNLLNRQITSVINNFKSSIPLSTIDTFIALGSDARFAAEKTGEKMKSNDFHTMDRKKFDRLVNSCQKYTAEQLAQRHGISFSDAETLNPALLVYQALLHQTPLKQMIVSDVSMRDGLLLDLVRRITGQEDRDIAEATLESAKTIAEKYNVDMKHTLHCVNLCDRLFDELKPLHGLGHRQKVLLKVAAYLHEIGIFVATRAHHKHTFYLIAHSDVFGLSHNELLTVAHVARYHRRNSPKPTHLDYMNLPRQMRMTICRLAALIRLADALDSSRTQQIETLDIEIRDEDIVLYIPGPKDITLERRSVASKSDLFEEIYGKRIRIEEMQLIKD